LFVADGRFGPVMPVCPTECFVLKKRLIELAFIFAGLLAVSCILWITDADRRLASFILGAEKVDPVGNKFWPAGRAFPWNLLYLCGPVPAFILAGTALTGLIGGFFVPRLARCRKKTLFVLLFIALGPGLVVNVLLKDQLGRARPREVIEYGGDKPFTQFWQTGNAGRNGSFPSGHAAIAFFVIAPWFVLRDEKKKPAVLFLVTGLSFGTLVGIARILQGGHFISDVIWSAGLVYLTGGLLALALGFGREDSCCSSSGSMAENT
jgi:membrane-associated PAP2 superfamily phosphatase